MDGDLIPPILPVGEMADLLAGVVAGVAGGSKAAGRKHIIEAEQLPTWKCVAHNWRWPRAARPSSET